MKFQRDSFRGSLCANCLYPEWTHGGNDACPRYQEEADRNAKQNAYAARLAAGSR